MRRMILGMSQDKLGEALGLTFQQIQKYEKGVNRIGASRVFEMAKILEVPIQYFYEDFGGKSARALGFAEAPDDSFMQLLYTPEGVQLCRHFSEIKDPKVRKKVLELVKTLSKGDNEESHA